MTTLMKSVAERRIARPLRILVPLIKAELARGDAAALEHYRLAGEMLLEAKESGQLSHGSWGRWLTRNFALSRMTAYRYMTLAERVKSGAVRIVHDTTLSEAIGEKQSDAARPARGVAIARCGRASRC